MTHPEPDWDTEMESRAESERDHFAAEYRQSATACCPRETIPDSCSCPDGCQCLCRDCDCCRCPDCGRGDCTGEDCYWPDEAGLR